jgi:hypothetical protein
MQAAQVVDFFVVSVTYNIAAKPPSAIEAI